MELGCHYSFQEFTTERKVGDWPVVVEVSRVQSRLFEDGSDRCGFEGGRNSAGFK